MPPGPWLQQACIYETFCSLLLLQYVVVLTAASPAILLVDPVFLTKRFLSHSTGKKETPFQVRIKVPFVLSPIPICRCRRAAHCSEISQNVQKGPKIQCLGFD